MQTYSKAADVRKRLLEFSTLMSFYYNGVYCNIDPFSPTNFHLMCGDMETDMTSIDDVMNSPFFNGKSLAEIADIVDFDEW